MNLDGVPLRGERVGFFFDNLLPDSEVLRQRLRSVFRTQTGDTFDLLEAVGRDCVGALQLLPEGQSPEGVTEISATPVSNGEIEKMLVRVASGASGLGPQGTDDEFRISIAGAQEKTALTWHNKRWCKPHGSTPTTHIFKLPLGLVGDRQMDMSTSLENEWLCAQLLAEYGVPVAPCRVAQFGDAKALVVERFDRALHSSGRYWLRLPQEDLCQATGTPGGSKYEADGGPGIIDIARVLQGSERRDEDLATLLRTQLLFWMLGATDGHAKNFSIHLLAQGRYRLTPIYDVISAWPIAGPRHNQVHPKKLKLAMALRGTSKHYRVSEVQRRHFNATAQACGFASDMEPIIKATIAQTPAVIARVSAKLPKAFPEALFTAITRGLQRSADLLDTMQPV
jgi:serine/threonine-protein kinase HipA